MTTQLHRIAEFSLLNTVLSISLAFWLSSQSAVPTDARLSSAAKLSPLLLLVVLLDCLRLRRLSSLGGPSPELGS